MTIDVGSRAKLTGDSKRGWHADGNTQMDFCAGTVGEVLYVFDDEIWIQTDRGEIAVAHPTLFEKCEKNKKNVFWDAVRAMS